MPFHGCRKVFFPQGSNVVFFFEGQDSGGENPRDTDYCSSSVICACAYLFPGGLFVNKLAEIASSNSSRRLFLSVGLRHVQGRQ